MAGTITLAAIDRDRMLLDGLRAWLRAEPDLLLAFTAGTVADFLAGGPAVDVVLLALDAGTAAVVRRLPGRVLLITPAAAVAGPAAAGPTSVPAGERRAPAEGSRGAVAESLTAALLAGAAGHVSRNRGLGALVEAVRAVAASRSPGRGEAPAAVPVPGVLRLSRQERAVLLSYATGSTLQAAAHRAGVTYGTARGYLERVKRKYTEAGRPTYTKLDLASRLREDLAGHPLGGQP
jgi:two-component system nitrate/nitrite response regulator NarL